MPDDDSEPSSSGGGLNDQEDDPDLSGKTGTECGFPVVSNQVRNGCGWTGPLSERGTRHGALFKS